jgi:hypothetical protein
MLEQIKINDWLQTVDMLKKNKFSQLVKQIRTTLLEKLATDLFSERLHHYLTNINADGEPFTNYEHEPADVSQIKKIINALYFGELALLEVEAVSFPAGFGTEGKSMFTDLGNLFSKSTFTDLGNLFSKAISYVSQAGHLATHLDVNFFEVFQSEIDRLLPVFAIFQTYTKSLGDATFEFMDVMDSTGITRNVGLGAGIALNQLNPTVDGPDYKFLAFFGADIPQYLDQLSSFIKQFSSDVSGYAPNINRERLDELQEQASLLFDALEGARGSSVFLPLQVLYYIHAIRHTVTLSLNIVEQAGFLSSTSQDAIRTNIRELKKILAQLCSSIDKVEVQAMLKPGTLSAPFTQQISNFYQELINYTAKFVKFSIKDVSGNAQDLELLTLSDSKFVSARLGYSYDRQVAAKKELLILEDAQIAADNFFNALQHTPDKNKRISSLSQPIKAELANYYKVLRSYVLNIDNSVHRNIMEGLINSRDTYKIKDILPWQRVINTALDKRRASLAFRYDLNTDVISNISSSAQNLTLYPQAERENPFKFDEKAALGQGLQDELIFTLENGNNLLANPEHLKTDQAIMLYESYKKRCIQLEHAQHAYEEFSRAIELPVALLLPLDIADRKNKLRNLYSMFQPYLPDDDASKAFDSTIIAAFSSEEPKQVDNLLDILERVKHNFDALQTHLNQRLEIVNGVVSACRIKDVQAEVLELEPISDRALHVIKHTEFSTAVSKLRTYFYQQIPLLNDSFKAHLQFNTQADTLPFPDINDSNKQLAQSNQILVYKQLFNCLYYLEKIMVGLEGLQDQASEKTYIGQLFKWVTDKRSQGAYTLQIIGIANNVVEAYVLLDALANTPYLSVVITEIQKKLQSIQTAIPGLQAYYVPHQPAAADGEAPTSYSALFYAMHTILFLPAHITAIRADRDVQPDAVGAIHQYAQRVTADLERILQKSNSPWKLSTEVLTMYRLFGELKQKLQELTSTSYDVVFSNLGAINDDILSNILLELDRWEDNVGLQTGSLTQPVIKMFDAFYDGFLEPLDLSSQDRLRFRMSRCPIDKRIEATTARIREAEVKLAIAKEKQATLKLLVDSIAHYERCERDKTCSSDILRGIQSAVKTNFQAALLLLEAEKHHLVKYIPDENEKDAIFCHWVTFGIEPVPELRNIRALAIACYNHYKGVCSSHQLTIDTATNKISHLNELLAARPALENHLVSSYAAASLNKKKAHVISEQRLPFDETKLVLEYTEALKDCLQHAEARILAQITVQDIDIDKKIDELLNAEVVKFRNENLHNYHHLDKIMGAVAQLRRYVNHDNVIFESETTLAEKKQAIDVLGIICHRDCVLIKRQSNPMQDAFSEIMRLSEQRYAVILFNEELFYADVVQKSVTKIEITADKQTEFQTLKAKFKDTFDSCKNAELSHSNLINTLRGRARANAIPDRINEVRHYLRANERAFKRTMHKNFYHNFLTLNWWAQTTVWLFELAGLYTPERKAAYNGLVKTVANDIDCQFQMFLNELRAIRFQENAPVAKELKELLTSLESLPDKNSIDVVNAIQTLCIYFRKLSAPVVNPDECTFARLDFEQAIKDFPGHPDDVIRNIGIAFMSLGAAILVALATTAGLGLLAPAAIAATALVAASGVAMVSVGLVGMFASKTKEGSPYTQAQTLVKAVDEQLNLDTIFVREI